MECRIRKAQCVALADREGQGQWARDKESGESCHQSFIAVVNILFVSNAKQTIRTEPTLCG